MCLHSQYSRGEEGYSIRRFVRSPGTQIWYSSTKYKEIMEKATQPDYQESESDEDKLKQDFQNAKKKHQKEVQSQFLEVYKNLLDDENVETTQPTLSKEEAHSYFTHHPLMFS